MIALHGTARWLRARSSNASPNGGIGRRTISQRAAASVAPVVASGHRRAADGGEHDDLGSWRRRLPRASPSVHFRPRRGTTRPVTHGRPSPRVGLAAGAPSPRCHAATCLHVAERSKGSCSLTSSASAAGPLCALAAPGGSRLPSTARRPWASPRETQVLGRRWRRLQVHAVRQRGTPPSLTTVDTMSQRQSRLE